MSDKPIHFGPFSLELQGGLLLCGGERIHLRPQAAQVLTYLVEHEGELVSRRTLTDLLWADSCIDQDHGLNAIVRSLRNALDDDSANPKYIETIPRKGYRFVAQCTTGGPADPPHSRPTWRLPALIALVLGFVIVALTVLDMLPGVSQAPTLDEIPEVARRTHVAGLNDYMKGDIASSLPKFQEVVSLAPEFAEGHLLLGKSTFFARGSNLHSAELAEPHLRESLRLKSELSSAHVALGRIAVIKSFDIKKATTLAQKALSMDPSDTSALKLLAEIRIAQGDSEGAINFLKQIEQVDPLREINLAHLGWISILGGNYDTAARYCRSALEADGQNIDALSCLFDAYFSIGANDLSRQYAVDYMKFYDAPLDDVLFVERADANEAIQRYLSWRLEIESDEGSQGGRLYPLIMVHQRLGDTEAANSTIRKIVNERHFPSITRLVGDVRLVSLSAHADLRSEFDPAVLARAPVGPE
jgi:DNA-binding winged helix-turn-helix (wHTH) protein